MMKSAGASDLSSVTPWGGSVEMTRGARFNLEALYAAQWLPMVRLAVLLVDDRGAAEDVVQDAFVGLYRRPPHNADAAVGYLRTSVVNGARSLLRRRGVARKHLLELRSENAEGADHSILVAAEHAEVVAALRHLPRRQREVLVLRYWSHLSEAEIAQTLGVSTGTVKSTASRGLDALEAKLGELR
jgi:RNA polymerase sigma-70 factor (sigma-E family)